MKHFNFKDLVRSNIAREKGFTNEPYAYETIDVYENLERLVDKLLDPIQELVAAPVIITSGYRCRKLNELVGGVPDSQHRKGYAADFYVKDFSKSDMKELFLQLCEELDYDQMILYSRRGFIHVSYVSPELNRRESIIRKS